MLFPSSPKLIHRLTAWCWNLKFCNLFCTMEKNMSSLAEYCASEKYVLQDPYFFSVFAKCAIQDCCITNIFVVLMASKKKIYGRCRQTILCFAYHRQLWFLKTNLQVKSYAKKHKKENHCRVKQNSDKFHMCNFNWQLTQLSYWINHSIKTWNNVQCLTEQHRGQLTLCKGWTLAQICRIVGIIFRANLWLHWLKLLTRQQFL